MMRFAASVGVSACTCKCEHWTLTIFGASETFWTCYLNPAMFYYWGRTVTAKTAYWTHYKKGRHTPLNCRCTWFKEGFGSMVVIRWFELQLNLFFLKSHLSDNHTLIDHFQAPLLIHATFGSSKRSRPSGNVGIYNDLRDVDCGRVVCVGQAGIGISKHF